MSIEFTAHSSRPILLYAATIRFVIDSRFFTTEHALHLLVILIAGIAVTICVILHYQALRFLSCTVGAIRILTTAESLAAFADQIGF